ncbi:LLM class flavin-dependent oxidoreductase [Streptomyces litchfieldiae]|uniref:LLM class flavin-dependent oxidoreductase n=1 Tax=Streptomyces litchfieldiae TaxID=3075543 RepID=A0ABU2MQV8_9ACTN|nr:LLM class flavin-dependent oxidoreductase [Streptomyces sp. DSM 44938]MDT0343738.1 LLM class flavin-dependent oxidoreductase [Streptomyces sp. DSM 44938]
MNAHDGRLSFGIKTTPAHIGYDDILRVWQEADAIPGIEHAWLWDHLLPVFGPPDGQAHDSWTLLAALAARTERLRLGLLVTANVLRPPALLAKIAATTDVISRGRLTMGIGVGGTRRTSGGAGGGPGKDPAAEYAALGVGLVSPAEGVARLAESCAILRRLWTEDTVDFTGRYYRLTGARCVPRPERRPPLLIGGSGTRTLRVVAEHADIWNMPGPPHNDAARIRERARILDGHCAAIGRDPAEITRSAQFHVSYDDPAATRATVLELIDAGVTHLVLSLPMPFPPGVARWAADEIITPVTERAAAG